MGQVSAHWSKYDSRNSFIRVGSDGRNTVQETGQSSLWFFTAIQWCVRGFCKQRLLESGYEFGRINPKESLAGIFLLRVDNI